MTVAVAIVGNGPIASGSRPVIDAAELVIRFNEPTHPAEVAGARTDILFLANSGKTMQQRLAGSTFRTSPAFVAASKVILSYHPTILARYHGQPWLLSRLKGRKLDWTTETIAMCREAGKEIEILNPTSYELCCDAIGIAPRDRRKHFPSSGVLALRYVLTELRVPGRSVRLFGFTWEGWKRHSWRQEQAWAQSALSGSSALR